MRIPNSSRFGACLLCLLFTAARATDRAKHVRPSSIDQYVDEAERRAAAQSWNAASGSLWYPGAMLTDLGRDPKASQINDLVTIIVAERATAVAKGNTKTSRKSSSQHSIGALYGKLSAAGPWGNLASTSGSSDLDGQGATSRENTLTTTLSARVVNVLSNGYLVVEGTKNVTINSEAQIVTVRGVVRPTDLSPGNLIRSDRLAQLEVQIDGKGVVGDAIRRPFFLYRLLLGLLPF